MRAKIAPEDLNENVKIIVESTIQMAEQEVRARAFSSSARIFPYFFVDILKAWPSRARS
jgi:hypothetical protein